MSQQKPKTVTRYLPGGMNVAVQRDFLLEQGQISSKNKTQKKKKKKAVEINVESFEIDDDFLEYTNQKQQHSVSLSNSQKLNSTVSEECATSKPNGQTSQIVDDTTPKKCIPPKTICRNKSIVLDINVPKSSVFDVDVKTIQMPSVSSKPEVIDVKQSNVSAPVASKPVEMTFKDKVLQTINKYSTKHKSSPEKAYLNHDIKCNNSKNVNSPEVEGNCVPSHKTNKVLCEEITQNKEPLKKVVEQLTQQNAAEEKEGWYEENVTFSEGRNEAIAKRSVPLLRVLSLANSKIQVIREISKNIIVHGVIIPKPVHSLEEAFFSKAVSEALQAAGCTCPTELQSFMWPAIQRGLNVFMVAPSQSGKRFAYLPALITFTVELSENYKSLKKYKGPLVIIICTDNEKCKEVTNLIYNLIQDSWKAVKIGTTSNMPSLEACDVLVATLSDVEKLLKSGKITLKRLCHIVLDKASVILKNDSRPMTEFLRTVNEMQKNRPNNKNIQVIVSSQKWTADLDTLMRKLYLPPVVCFMDFLEATLYSNIPLKKKKLSAATHKKFLLGDILKQKYSTYKSIVFCDENEIVEVKEYLHIKGIECISISNDLIEGEIFENEDMWCSLTIERFKVLLCTDELFKKTGHIVNANWLIHYSLPLDCKTFQHRFRCLAENIKYPLTIDPNDNDMYEENRSYMFIVGDSQQASSINFNDFFSELVSAKVRFLKL